MKKLSKKWKSVYDRITLVSKSTYLPSHAAREIFLLCTINMLSDTVRAAVQFTYHKPYIIFRSAVARFIDLSIRMRSNEGRNKGTNDVLRRATAPVRRWIIQSLICTTQWKRRIRFRHRFCRSPMALIGGALKMSFHRSALIIRHDE